MSERWRAVPGYEHKYQVSDKGRVRSVQTGKVLKPDNVAGYLRCTLSKDNHTERYRVHRLVATVFIPNPEEKPQVNHINGIKTDNRVENLEWCTGSENQTHSRRVLKRHCGLPKRRVQCVETGAIYPSISETASALDISISNVYRVLQGELKQTHNLHFIFI